MTILELLDNESKWSKGTNAQDERRISVVSNAPNACRWCLNGAVLKCYGNDSKLFQIQDELDKSVKKLFPKFSDFVQFNDHIETTFDDVRCVLEDAQI